MTLLKCNIKIYLQDKITGIVSIPVHVLLLSTKYPVLQVEQVVPSMQLSQLLMQAESAIHKIIIRKYNCVICFFFLFLSSLVWQFTELMQNVQFQLPRIIRRYTISWLTYFETLGSQHITKKSSKSNFSILP